MYRIRREGEQIWFPGVDMGNGEGPYDIVKRWNGHIVIKVKGHKRWTGNYMPRAYEPTKFVVFREIGVNYEVEEVIRFPAR